MKDKVKVLYVDDEEVNLLLFKKIMEKNYTIITAGNGEKGLQILEEQPDIKYVISDMRMPLMSGLDFIRIAKKKFDDKRYFILTGYNANEETQEAVDSKLIIQYWTKPADFDEIDRYLQA